VVDTHTHADHLSGVGRLAQRAGATVLAHAASKLKRPARRVTGGTTFALGTETVTVLVRSKFRTSPSSATLRHLLRHLQGPVDLLWDRGPIHRRRNVQYFLVRHRRLPVHFFPAYAPELNPAEYVWAQADGALANGAPDALVELRQSLGTAIRRLRRSEALL
jgi:transposase